jgi:hypothetical protein
MLFQTAGVLLGKCRFRRTQESEMIRKLVRVLSVVAVGIAFNGAALADEHEGCDRGNLVQSGTIQAHVTRVGFLVAVRWGDGVLTLNNGEKHKYDILGLKLVETGIAEMDLEGEIYNLKNLRDFEGVYYGSSAAATLVKGKGEAMANNAKCVFIRARATTAGIQLSAPAPGGVQIKFSN